METPSKLDSATKVDAFREGSSVGQKVEMEAEPPERTKQNEKA